MKTINQHISTINFCENLFCTWVKNELRKVGVELNGEIEFSEILSRYTKEFQSENQHIKPLVRWNENKKRCVNLSSKKNLVNGDFKNYESLLEKTAFDGQVLWLTLKNN